MIEYMNELINFTFLNHFNYWRVLFINLFIFIFLFYGIKINNRLIRNKYTKYLM